MRFSNAQRILCTKKQIIHAKAINRKSVLNVGCLPLKPCFRLLQECNKNVLKSGPF